MQAQSSSSKAFDIYRPPASSLDSYAPAERERPRLLELVQPPGSGPLHLLVIDSDASVREACCETAGKLGLEATAVEDLHEAKVVMEDATFDVVLLDPRFSQGSGLDLLADVRALLPESALLVMTDCASVTSAVEAMRAGAGDYLTKPFDPAELARILRRAAERQNPLAERRRLRAKLRGQRGAGYLAGSSPEMEKLYRMLSKVADTGHPVLIVGEGGTGKELVARAIHFHGPRAERPFVPVDCGSLMPSLIEGELFGYVKGAFPGAVRGKEGLLTSREGGTVLLDEVTEMPVDVQSKLLRALQDKTARPVGGTQLVPVVARVLAATNRNLSAMVEQGRFRRDLYFRLNVVTLRIPSLRERRGDIVELAEFFLEQQGRQMARAHRFSGEALEAFFAYDWPGNVRELETVVERACSLSSGPVIHLADLPAELQRECALTDVPVPHEFVSEGEGGIVPLAELERETIHRTLRQLKGDKLLAAKLLGIGKTTLYRKLKEYGMVGVGQQHGA